jgi:hypothetical protein
MSYSHLNPYYTNGKKRENGKAGKTGKKAGKAIFMVQHFNIKTIVNEIIINTRNQSMANFRE